MQMWSEDATQPSLTQSGNLPNFGPPSGGFPPPGPPPGSPSPYGSPPGGAPVFYRYHPALLAVMAGLYLLALFILCPISTAFTQTPTGTVLVGAYLSILLGTIVCVLILDWRGFFLLRGLLPWRWPLLIRLLLAAVFVVLFFFTLLVYFVRALLDLRRPVPGAVISVAGMPPSRRSRGRTITGVASGLLIIGCLLISSIGAAASGGGLVSPTPTPGQIAQHPTATPASTQEPTTGATSTPTAAPTATPTPSPTATSTPTPQPTATTPPAPTPTPKPPTPTPTPKSSCAYSAVNGNPWCYNFSCCTNIYSPPSNFCSYFTCIANFWNGNGYVEECQDGTYSKSGGISGSCSHHGGNLRALLQP